MTPTSIEVIDALVGNESLSNKQRLEALEALQKHLRSLLDYLEPWIDIIKSDMEGRKGK